jgi:hypothetical protein
VTPRLHAGPVITFLLLQADPGHAETLAQYVAGLPGVLSAAVTSGPYDIVAEVAGGEEQQAAVRSAIRRARGLCRLCVCRPESGRRTAVVSNA